MQKVKNLFCSSENDISIVMFLYLFLVPQILGSYEVYSYSYYLTCVLLAFSVTLIWGFTGIFSFGQAAFLGIGGYAYGIIAQLLVDNPAGTIIAALLAILIAAAFAALLGYMMFYGGINDVFVGLITMCVTITLETFMGQTSGQQWQIAGIPLGGYNGLSGIPMIGFGGKSLGSVSFYYLVLIVVFAIYLVLRTTQRSRMGYSMIAIRENRNRSELFGYNIKFLQMMVFTFGGALAGLSGVLYAAWGNYITPSSMSLNASTIPVVLVAAGGRMNVSAALIFTFFYYLFSMRLSSTGSQYALVILGLFLIIVILFMPEGLLSTLFRKIDSLFRKRSGHDE